MFQVLFKTTNDPTTGAHSWDLGTREVAEAFVQRPDIWWWAFPLDDDTAWRKGGAWEQKPDSRPEAMAETQPRQPAPPPAAPATEDDEDEDRW